MFDTLEFAEDIFAQKTSPAQPGETTGIPALNRQHLTAIISYQHLTDHPRILTGNITMA